MSPSPARQHFFAFAAADAPAPDHLRSAGAAGSGPPLSLAGRSFAAAADLAILGNALDQLEKLDERSAGVCAAELQDSAR